MHSHCIVSLPIIEHLRWMMAIQAWIFGKSSSMASFRIPAAVECSNGRCLSDVVRLESSSQNLWQPLALQTASPMLSAGLRAAPSHQPGNVSLTRKQYWEGEKGHIYNVLLCDNHKMNSSDVLLTSWGFRCSLNAPFLDEGYCLQVFLTRWLRSADYTCQRPEIYYGQGQARRLNHCRSVTF